MVSIYAFGCIIGNIVSAPFSEIYGRRPVFHIANVLFLALAIACAVSSSLKMLMTFRFFHGASSSVCITLSGPIVGDLFIQEERGTMMSVVSIGQVIGPISGPIIGGFLSQAKGWRWIFWLMAIAVGAVIVPSFLLIRETYAPKISQQNKSHPADATKKDRPSSIRILEKKTAPWKHIGLAMARLLQMVTVPMVLMLAMNLSIIWGCLYIVFTTMNEIFEGTFRFSEGALGLSYIGIGSILK